MVGPGGNGWKVRRRLSAGASVGYGARVAGGSSQPLLRRGRYRLWPRPSLASALWAWGRRAGSGPGAQAAVRLSLWGCHEAQARPSLDAEVL